MRLRSENWDRRAPELYRPSSSIACLLDLGCDVNYFDAKNAHPRLRRVLALARLVFRVTKRPPLAIIEFLVVGFGTAVHTAAYRGNLGAVGRRLIRWRPAWDGPRSDPPAILQMKFADGVEPLCEPVLS